MENNSDALGDYLKMVYKWVHSDIPLEQRKKEAKSISDGAMPACEKFLADIEASHPDFID